MITFETRKTARVAYDGSPRDGRQFGTIMGEVDGYVRIRLDDGRVGNYHKTWKLEYDPNEGEEEEIALSKSTLLRFVQARFFRGVKAARVRVDWSDGTDGTKWMGRKDLQKNIDACGKGDDPTGFNDGLSAYKSAHRTTDYDEHTDRRTADSNRQ